jgi:TetR/AcrR family transcriptional regulator, transcriptional repressor for nem operon
MGTDSVNKIMSVAQELVQHNGYNAFSYHDIARKLGIKSASIHYYFPAKSDLGKALMHQYRMDFNKQLKLIDTTSNSTINKLDHFAELFLNYLRSKNKMCLCGMLASDINTMPVEIRDEVRLFFIECENWLAMILDKGQQLGEIRNTGQPDKLARFILAGMEGAMLSARSFEDPERFNEITSQIFSVIRKS